MPVTRENGIPVPVNSDAYDPTGDITKLADGSNVLIKATQAQRDALTKVNGKAVIRTDIAQAPIERCDGSTWFGQAPHEEWTFSNPANTVPNGAAWGPGIGTLDTSSNSIYTGFGSTPANDTFQVNAPGRYLFHWYLVLAGAAGAPVFMAFNNGSGGRLTAHQWPNAFEHDISIELNLPAGGQVKLVYVQTGGSTYNAIVNHRLRVSKNG
jgi:hypothetical protein